MSQIKCPNCQTLIDIDQVLYEQLESAAKAKLQKEIEEHRQKYREAMEELRSQKEAVELAQKRLEQEAQLKAQELLQKELAKEKQRIKAQIQQEQESLIKNLQAELAHKSDQVKELYETKAALEKLKREKEEALQAAKLEAQKELNKTLEMERAKMKELLQKEEEALRKKIASEAELKLKEKEIQLAQLKKQLEEAKQKAEQSSQQLQGEAQEILIEEWLRLNFPLDEIDEVKKGARGGDCIQIVNDPSLPNCGTIYYESKRTKEFQRAWIEKFKKDMREIGADVGVIVTQSMPKELERMGVVDGVWICNFEEFKALSFILREHLIQLAFAQKSQENRADKMEMLYRYLTSNEFKMQIEAIIESFTKMQEDLNKEKRAMQRIWKEREKQIQKVLENTTALYGSLRGIAGNAIAPISSLQLPYEDQA